MNDWLVPLLQIGGTGAVVAFALFIMGRWLLNHITTALKSYVTAYAQQTANIDARIANLEKLAAEQARLTRTVESIKDEIAAQAKSRDNQWAFRTDVYITLVKTTHDMLKSLHNFSHAAKLRADPNEALRNLATATIEAEQLRWAESIKEFTTYAALAPLATADAVLPILAEISKQAIREVNFNTPHAAAEIQEQMQPLFNLLNQLQKAGRKDLWPELGSTDDASHHQ
jgi:cell division protein FtsB